MHTHRHDSLVDIVYYALCQSHPGVLKEQHVSGDVCSHPGDAYHPDFEHSHPAYFDLLVCSTTHAYHISSSSSCVGVAATAWELAKDSRDRDVVQEAGCDFFPLVVATFGIRSPFALHALYQVADRITAQSGASHKVGLKEPPAAAAALSITVDKQC